MSIEDAVVPANRPSFDLGDHVRLPLAVADSLEERQAGGRRRCRVVEGEEVAANVDGALDLEAVAEDVARAGMEVASPGDLIGAPGARVLAAGVEQDRVLLTEQRHRLACGLDRKSTRLNSSHRIQSRMPSSA